LSLRSITSLAEELASTDNLSTPGLIVTDNLSISLENPASVSGLRNIENDKTEKEGESEEGNGDRNPGFMESGTASTSTGTDSGTAPNPGVHASTNSGFFRSLAGETKSSQCPGH
jgi:hypothetical protein